jgi:hypothetical protein
MLQSKLRFTPLCPWFGWDSSKVQQLLHFIITICYYASGQEHRKGNGNGVPSFPLEFGFVTHQPQVKVRDQPNLSVDM